MIDPGNAWVGKIAALFGAAAIERVFGPSRIKARRHAEIEAQVQEMLHTARAEIDIEKMRKGEATLIGGVGNSSVVPVNASFAVAVPDAQLRAEPTLQEAIYSNSLNTWARREANCEQCVRFAEDSLDPSMPVPDEAVDIDWFHRWREGASAVSNERVQEFWGKLLANELTAPGSNSLRTMEFLKSCDKSDADEIVALARVLMNHYLYYDQEFLSRHGFVFRRILALESLGVLAGASGGGSSLHMAEVGEPMDWLISGKRTGPALHLRDPGCSAEVHVPVVLLSPLGQALVELTGVLPTAEVLEDMGESLKERYPQIREVALVEVTDVVSDRSTFVVVKQLRP